MEQEFSATDIISLRQVAIQDMQLVFEEEEKQREIQKVKDSTKLSKKQKVMNFFKGAQST